MSSFKNLYSDHKAISLRISYNVDAKLIIDKRSTNRVSTFIASKEEHHSQETITPQSHMKNNSRGEILVFDEETNVELVQSDLSTLDSRNWLNDSVINMYLTFVAKSTEPFKKVKSVSTFFHYSLVHHGYDRAKKFTRRLEIFNTDLLLIPIHVPGHWILVACGNLQGDTVKICLYDPKYGERYQTVLSEIEQFLMKNYEETCGRPWLATINLIVENDIPKQDNDYDCGAFLCQIAKYITLDLDFNFIESDMGPIRELMKSELLWRKIKTTQFNRARYCSTEATHEKQRRLSTKKPEFAKRTFANKSGDLCWINCMAQLIIKALDSKEHVDVVTDLGREFMKIQQSSCPKIGFDCRKIRNLISTGQFVHLSSGQQDIVEGFDAINTIDVDTNEYKWQDIASIFKYHSKIVCKCASSECTISREEDALPKMYITVSIPSDLFFCQISSVKMRTLIEDCFRHQKFQQERSGCDLHQSSGAFQLEVIEKAPDYLLVIINRITTKLADNGDLIYVLRDEQCIVPQMISLPDSQNKENIYHLYGVVEYAGNINYQTGQTEGHYTVDLKYGSTWYRANDNILKKLRNAAGITKKPYVCAYTRNYC